MVDVNWDILFGFVIDFDVGVYFEIIVNYCDLGEGGWIIID